MAETVKEQPYYTNIFTPWEQAAHTRQLLDDALFKKAQQERQQIEDLEFSKQLDAKTLAELMRSQRQQREEAERKMAALAKIAEEELAGAMSHPHTGAVPANRANDEYYSQAISYQDWDRIVSVSREQHIAVDIPAIFTTSFSPVQQDQNPERELEKAKEWLRDTFPARPTDAILAKTESGENVLISLGVSSEEIQVAKDLQNDKRRAEGRSAEITAKIQEKIKEASPGNAAHVPNEMSRALPTPIIGSESMATSRMV